MKLLQRKLKNLENLINKEDVGKVNRSKKRIADISYRRKISKEYAEFLINQNECQICTLPFKGDRDQHIDHCHDSDMVRGVLCRSCNIMLGYAKNNPQRMLNGIKYLESHYSHWDSVLENYG